MPIFNRIYCASCKNRNRVYKEGLKEVPCSKCQTTLPIKKNDFYIEVWYKGRRVVEHIGPSRTMAEKVLTKRKAEAIEDKLLDRKNQERVKFSTFAVEYFELHCKVNNKKSVATTIGHLDVLKGYFKDLYLHEITPHMVQNFKAYRLQATYKTPSGAEKSYTVATVNRYLATLKGLFTKAELWARFQGPNPVKSIKFFKENNTRLRFLEKEEVQLLLNQLEGMLRPIVIIALNSGMRKGELQRLKWRDIDFQRGFLKLHETKSGESRQIPLNDVLIDTLIAIPKSRVSELVFVKPNGEGYGDWKKQFNKAVKDAGIKDFHFHDLRHTFASHLVMNGIDLNTVRELLGHKSLEMTLRYAHLSPNFKQRAVGVLGNVFAGSAKIATQNGLATQAATPTKIDYTAESDRLLKQLEVSQL